MSTLSLHEAEQVLAAGVAQATEISVPANIAVLDAGVNLKAFARMDGALLGSIDIAIGKARTSALFQMNSEELFEFCKPGGTSFGLENTNGGLVVFAGGRPLVVGGEFVGAVGVSGGAVAQDDAIAEAAAAALSAAAV
jgi:uncharacterized protein GlcG (DUF336 family)